MTRAAAMVAVLALTLQGCALMGAGKSGRGMTTYLLEIDAGLEPVAQQGCHVVIVTPPEPAPGYATAQMVYRRTAHQLDSFAYSRWAESPASMLEPMLVDALRRREAFAAVLASPAPVKADLRVESEGLKLIQVFEGNASSVELDLDVRVYAPADRRLLANRKLEYTERARATTAEAGVEAADRALRRMLADFTDLVIEAAGAVTAECRN